MIKKRTTEGDDNPKKKTVRIDPVAVRPISALDIYDRLEGPGSIELSRPRDPLRHGGDSDSDSDSERQTKKKKPQPPPPPQPPRQKPRTAAAAASTPLPPPPPPVNAAKKSSLPPTAAASSSGGKGRKKGAVGKPKNKNNKPDGAEQHKEMYRASMTPKPPDETRIVRLPDFLNQGELSVDLMADIERMYGPTTWDEPNAEDDLPLFQIDHEEKTRASLIHKGVFYNPRLFSLIRKMLERNPSGRLTTQQLQNEIATLYSIEPVPRCYEEMMLASPKDGERACSNGTGCQSHKWWGFIMKEFITPLELAEMKMTRIRNNVVKMCLVCVRKSIDFLQTSYIIGGLRNPENYINQFHRNEVNKKGEYTFEYSIPLGNGIIYPVIMNNKLAYVYHTDGSSHWVTQDGYRHCTQEDIEQQNFHTGTLRQKKPENGSFPKPPSQLPQPRPSAVVGEAVF
jgi:hypothetical protein